MCSKYWKFDLKLKIRSLYECIWTLCFRILINHRLLYNTHIYWPTNGCLLPDFPLKKQTKLFFDLRTFLRTSRLWNVFMRFSLLSIVLYENWWQLNESNQWSEQLIVTSIFIPSLLILKTNFIENIFWPKYHTIIDPKE